MVFFTILFWVCFATIFAAMSFFAYHRYTAPTPPQYKTVLDMTIKALVFFKISDAPIAFERMHNESISDNTAAFSSATGLYLALPIKSGNLIEKQVSDARLKRLSFEQTLSFDCSDAQIDTLQLFISWLRNNSVSAYAIAEDGTARRLDFLVWFDFSKRAFIFHSQSANLAPILGHYIYNVVQDGSHSFYNAQFGNYTSGGSAIGYWLLG